MTSSNRLWIALALALVAAAPVFAQYGRGTGTCCVTVAAGPATAEEAKALVHMREEEKLARDVYQTLYSQYNVRIFANIARSEQAHFDAIGVLLGRYAIADPSQSTATGVFTDPALAALYAELTQKGAVSLADALGVGTIIEKLDIADLENALAATTKTDIKTVYSNLLSGSLAHLEAFETALEVLAPAQQ
jgi:hypothetical protein